MANTPSKYGLSPSPDFTGDTLLGLLPTPRSSGQGSAHATLRLKVMAGNVPAEYPPIATRAGEHKTAGPALRKRLRGGPAAKISYYGIGTTFCGPGLCLKIGSRRLLVLLFSTFRHHSALFADSASGGTLTGSITRLLMSQFVRLFPSGLTASGG